MKPAPRANRTPSSFMSDQRGLETVENAIIAGLIVASVVLTLGAIGGWVSEVFNKHKTDVGA